jgi:hypothetical protein
MRNSFADVPGGQFLRGLQMQLSVGERQQIVRYVWDQLIRYFDGNPSEREIQTEVARHARADLEFEQWAGAHLLVIILLEMQAEHHKTIPLRMYSGFYETYMSMQMPASVYRCLGRPQWENRVAHILQKDMSTVNWSGSRGLRYHQPLPLLHR